MNQIFKYHSIKSNIVQKLLFNQFNNRILHQQTKRHLTTKFTNKLIVNSTKIKMASSIATSTTAASSVDNPKFTNRLATEKSTYLLQHAHNPVDWFPWGELAIQKARNENKVIFLSIGYSTCHWCHVMEKESFENEEIAKVMNEHFINIKVDREERPDIDKIYMNFVVSITGSGGWPMSVWLTPELAPVMVGTYFPPVTRWGTPGFVTVLQKVHERWTNDRDNLKGVSERIVKLVSEQQDDEAETGEGGATSTADTEASLLTAESRFLESINIYKQLFDKDWGGFRGAPKFPEVSKLNFVLNAHVQKPDAQLLELVVSTLKHIRKGGIHDHLFGGFSRYAVDRKWHIPHFEKMLYDQAQLLQVFCNVYKMTGDELYFKVADGIYEYITKDLQHPSGGFYSGEDADSYPDHGDPEKIEGAFYAWEWQEIYDIFQENIKDFPIKDAFDLFCYYYGVKEEGNVDPTNDPQGHLKNKNILMIQFGEEETASKFKTDIQTVQLVIKNFHKILHSVREKRPRPHLDTKIITSWNGLVLSGLSKLATCSTVDKNQQQKYLNTAEKLYSFAKLNLYDPEKKMLYRTCYGIDTATNSTSKLENPIYGFQDDYAYFIRGLLDYFVLTQNYEVLQWAKILQTTQDQLFWDPDKFGYFYSQENAENVLVRLKDDHDGAEPCGNSMAAGNLLLLGEYLQNEQLTQKATQLFTCFGKKSPFGYILPEMMSAMLSQDIGMVKLIVVGPGDDNELFHEFLQIIRNYYIPGMVLISFDPTNTTTTLKLLENVNHDEQSKLINNQPTVYLCRNNMCELPITNIDDLTKRLNTKYLFK